MSLANSLRSSRLVAARSPGLKFNARLPGLPGIWGNFSRCQPIRNNNTIAGFANLGSKRTSFTAGKAFNSNKAPTDIEAEVNELKTSALVINLRLDAIKSTITDVKSDLKDVRDHIQEAIKDLANKIDANGDKTDAKINRVVYFLIAGLMLKGGFDIYLNGETAREGKVNPQAAK